jgi:hypothetical protein
MHPGRTALTEEDAPEKGMDERFARKRDVHVRKLGARLRDDRVVVASQPIVKRAFALIESPQLGFIRCNTERLYEVLCPGPLLTNAVVVTADDWPKQA